MTTTVTTVTESVTPVTVIVIQSQLLSSSHSYRHNAAIPAARATCGQHKGPNMMMFSPLYQQRSAAASKLRARNLQSGPVRTGLEQLAPVRNLQSGTIRLRPIQTNPAESETSSQNQSRTSQDRLGTACARTKPPVWNNPTQTKFRTVRNIQSDSDSLRPHCNNRD